MTKPKNKGGRPSLYDTVWQHRLVEIEGWARDGLTNEQIAYNMGINITTFYRWQTNYEEFRESLKESKEIADRHVENALYQRALGYTYEEKTYERIVNTVIEPNGDVTTMPGTKIKTIVKQVAPDTTAQIFWLKNRKSAEWRDKKEVDVTVNKSLEDFFGAE